MKIDFMFFKFNC